MESLFLAALQSSFILGLIHGVNPCGHSWLVLAPFVSGQKDGRKVAVLTLAFVGGTAAACLVLGAGLGAVAVAMPPSVGKWVDLFTSAILLVLGVLLIVKPNLLHSHDHEEDHHHDSHHHHHHVDHHGHHDHHDDHDHHHHETQHHQHQRDSSCSSGCSHDHRSGWRSWLKPRATSHKWLAGSLFAIGFINMIIPCPTAAVMYGYALKASSIFAATMVFASYALSTAIAVGAVIFLIYRVTTMAGRLQKDWVEPLIMRLAGLTIVVFSGYGLYLALVPRA